MNKKTKVIIAPHVDDEIIGAYSIISNPDNKIIIIYSDFDMTQERQNEMVNVKKKFDNIKAYLKAREIPQQFLDENEYELYYPDPFHETHPHHKLIGNKGYDLFQQGHPVNFYSINMQAPYIYNVSDPSEKKKVLDELYPSQKSLWEMDAKYYLFEGHCSYVPERIYRGQNKIVNDGSRAVFESVHGKVNEVESEIVIPEIMKDE